MVRIPRFFTPMTRLRLTLRTALLVVALAAVPVAAQQVTVERDTPLYAEPRMDAAQVAQLKLGTTGEVIAKTGAWLNLKTSAGTGWLFSFNVRFQAKPGEVAQPAAGGGPSPLGRLFGPRRSVSITSTIGIRGLEEEDLKQARFDGEQLQQLDQYAATKEAAEEKARAGGLAPARVEFLTEGGR